MKLVPFVWRIMLKGRNYASYLVLTVINYTTFIKYQKKSKT